MLKPTLLHRIATSLITSVLLLLVIGSCQSWGAVQSPGVFQRMTEEYGYGTRQTTYRFAPIVSQTRISSQETGLSAIIECPIKTMNTNRERDVYQVDTGPVAFPDLGGGYERHVDRISLAFLAFNAPDFTDFA